LKTIEGAKANGDEETVTSAETLWCITASFPHSSSGIYSSIMASWVALTHYVPFSIAHSLLMIAFIYVIQSYKQG
jgi:hypothetical protein